MKLDVIYTNDCLEGMPKRLPDGCVDLMSTDPPYAIGFMNKEWDKFETKKPTRSQVVSWMNPAMKKDTRGMTEFFVPRWRECMRVLKPGGFAFVMCSPRADVMATQILCLQEAGFMVGFTPIFWAYASGFPKAQNIGKAVDKKLGSYAKAPIKEIKTDGTSPTGFDPKRGWHDHSMKREYEVKKRVSPQAQALDGSYAGFQPKPAVEVILVAMKPLSEKTYVDQALKNKKGITWLDGGRIPTEEYISNHSRSVEAAISKGKYGNSKAQKTHQTSGQKEGRFPANLLVSDDALNDGSKHRIGKLSGGFGAMKIGIGKPLEHQPYVYANKKYKVKGFVKNCRPQAPSNYNDSGSFSRYFSLDAWFEKKLKELPEGVQKTFPFLIVPKAGKAEKNRGCEELYWEKDNSSFGYHQVDKQRWEWLGKEEERIHKETGKKASLRARGNVHPTVKPIKLMSYLVALGSREGDVILDPYIGTGRTAIAATMMRRRYIGFDSSPESVKIAKAALSEVQLRLI